jgi:Sec-independent protein translocase protein TatA
MGGLGAELIFFAVIVLIIAAICILPSLGKKGGNQVRETKNADVEESESTLLSAKAQKNGTGSKRNKPAAVKSVD